jgi:WD40-like Beta Propeller Repeat
MPSVNPVNPNLIAFAGQPLSGSTYNEDTNYIYVMDTSVRDGPGPVMLEFAALGPGPFDPNYQGRAPWWSPDGKWVVFESNRPSQYEANGLYAIYLYQYGSLNPVIQITSTIYNCNHAKWFPPRSGRSGEAHCRGLAKWPPEQPYGALRPVHAGPVAGRHNVLISACQRTRSFSVSLDRSNRLLKPNYRRRAP